MFLLDYQEFLQKNQGFLFLILAEETIAYIDNDELVEVTPNNIRLRKKFLNPHERKRQARAAS